MKYADTQLTRPQYEVGGDWGHGRRSVLVRNGQRQLIHQKSYTGWSGIGMTATFPATWSLWSNEASGLMEHKIDIHEGRMTPQILATLAPRICEFLGVTFDIGLIRLNRTLLLDEAPGDVPEPPAPTPRKPPTPSPRVAGDTLYRIVEREDRPALAVFAIDEQRRGVVSYALASVGGVPAVPGRGFERKVTDLAAHGMAPTIEGAVELYLADATKRLADARLTRARAVAAIKQHDRTLRELTHAVRQAVLDARKEQS